MKVAFWVIVNSSGSVHTRKTKPDLSYNEVAVQINLTLPDGLFDKPQLKADLVVKEDQVTTYPVDATVTQDIKDAVKQATGMDLSIRIVEQGVEEDDE